MSVSFVSSVTEITEANMKFAVVVVLFAFAWGVNSSVVPLLSTVHGGVVVGAPAVAGSVAIQASAIPAAVPLSLSPAGPLLIQSGPAVIAAPAPAVIAAHAPAVVAVAAPEASYVAKTRGAVHVAPLPGHVQSAASVNLEPAPGTW
ncbi:adult cuticle protein 1 [Drosophila subpulchrella]|uniref:adult cuticle protein 1 n=1 Tax=Drosophila subpulchrella TaxID=1486046 RepID=UPI0018A17983|nr:adult cuticle protein 1 [Drosophila subpulchrella]